MCILTVGLYMISNHRWQTSSVKAGHHYPRIFCCGFNPSETLFSPTRISRHRQISSLWVQLRFSGLCSFDECQGEGDPRWSGEKERPVEMREKQFLVSVLSWKESQWLPINTRAWVYCVIDRAGGSLCRTESHLFPRPEGLSGYYRQHKEERSPVSPRNISSFLLNRVSIYFENAASASEKRQGREEGFSLWLFTGLMFISRRWTLLPV